MCFATTVREVRTSVGLSQQVLAGLVGVSQPYFSKLEKKEASFPDDVAEKVARALNSSRLHAEYVYEKKAEFFNVPVLNNVDDHVIVVLDSLIEEAGELIKHSQKLKGVLRNKKSKVDLSRQDLEEVMTAEEQIADIMPAIKLHLITMAERFELDIKELEGRMHRKLKLKGYKK